jgi:hypothetical protein
MGHDDRRSASDGDEADLQLRLFELRACRTGSCSLLRLLRHGALASSQREHGEQRSQQRAAADHGQERPARQRVSSKESTYDRAFNRWSMIASGVLSNSLVCSRRSFESDEVMAFSSNANPVPTPSARSIARFSPATRANSRNQVQRLFTNAREIARQKPSNFDV